MVAEETLVLVGAEEHGDVVVEAVLQDVLGVLALREDLPRALGLTAAVDASETEVAVLLSLILYKYKPVR